MAENADGYSLRKRLAMGLELPTGDFGVEKFPEVQGTVKTDTVLKDHERGAGPPVNGNQANPNHGYK